jgi:hypothetical protein
MRRSVVWALAAGMLVCTHAAASAQTSVPYVTSGEHAVDPETPRSVAPYGATYIPGVGFRYVTPGGLRVYGYRAYGPRVYGYRQERCSWFWDACGWRR